MSVMRVIAILSVGLLMIAGALVSSPYHSVISMWVEQIPGEDKTLHVVMMGMAAFFVVIGFSGVPHPTRRGRRISPAACMLFMLVFVTFDEFAQLWFPRRRFDLIDLLCSAVGVMVFGLLAAHLISRHERHREHMKNAGQTPAFPSS